MKMEMKLAENDWRGLAARSIFPSREIQFSME